MIIKNPKSTKSGAILSLDGAERRKEMKFLIGLFLAISLLAGCGEAKELLNKVGESVNQQMEIEGSENKADEMSIEVETSNSLNIIDKLESDGHENEADATYTLKERIERGDYEIFDLPNGFPLPMPLDWSLIEIINDGVGIRGKEYWEGVFCFDAEIESTIRDFEGSLEDSGFNVIGEPIDIEYSDNVHVTKYEYSNMSESWEGDMIYFIDHYGTACTKVYLIQSEE